LNFISKQQSKVCRGPSNEHSCTVWLQSYLYFLKRRYLNIFPKGPMLIYFMQWQPSWISDRHKKLQFCRGPTNDHSWADWFQLSKWFQRRSVLKHCSQRVQC
jgi:hypothetical protein